MMKNNHFILLVCILFGLQSPIAAQSSDWVYSPYAQYLTNDTTIPPPVGEPADAALSCFRPDTIYVLVMQSGELYIWLRPDLLMDKYIQSSPYAYCDGNPLIYIDPEGTDIWEVDDLGNILSHIVDETQDTFYKMSKDDKGNYYRSGCISFAYKTIEKQKTIKTAKGSYDIYQIRGDEQATELFEFMAQNTGVEWTQSITGIEGPNGLNFLTTSHETDTELGSSHFVYNRLYNGYTIRGFVHNHPDNNAQPSGKFDDDVYGPAGTWGDIGHATSINNYLRSKGAKIPIYLLYLPTIDYYVTYDEKTR